MVIVIALVVAVAAAARDTACNRAIDGKEDCGECEQRHGISSKKPEGWQDAELYSAEYSISTENIFPSLKEGVQNVFE